MKLKQRLTEIGMTLNIKHAIVAALWYFHESKKLNLLCVCTQRFYVLGTKGTHSIGRAEGGPVLILVTSSAGKLEKWQIHAEAPQV